MAESSYAKSINLPTYEIFRNIKNAKLFAVDIGGSLAKLAYLSTVPKKRSFVFESHQPGADGIYQVSEEDDYSDRLSFIKFETKYIETCFDFIKQNLIGSKEFMKDKCVKVTGGGAYKYTKLLTEKLGVQIDKEDEMDCLIKGCNFLLKNLPDESYLYQRDDPPEYQFCTEEDMFPYLLVNIGSGVSILKVESDTQYSRIGGTSMGGGTFWGLGSVLTSAKGFDDLLELASRGDHRNVDMLVQDIYGGSYESMKLPATLIASSFGKAARSARDSSDKVFSDADMAKSLLISISNDVGQIAYLNAKLHGLKKIYFGGYFIRGHPLTMHTMTYAIKFWSKGEMKPLFLRHEGYLGAIGAFLKGVEEVDTAKYSWNSPTSWGENYAGSSGLQSPNRTSFPSTSGNDSSIFDMLEMDRFTKPLVPFPLLHNVSLYQPDTADLNHDEEARNYWLQCFENATAKFAERAVSSQTNQADAHKRAELFTSKYIQRLKELRNNPCAYGALTVRSLLDTREHCLEEFRFVDPYAKQKHQENEFALKLLPERLCEIDSLTGEDRQLSVVKGLLAGNVFDWGAKEVALLLEENKLSFSDAMDKIQGRPWLLDDFDKWSTTFNKKRYKCATVFVDNSGMDIILGIFPFSRELLRHGIKVILCANSRPALNDVIYDELVVLTKRISLIDEITANALNDGRLFIMESGQGSPCLDLRYIDYNLKEKIKEHETDLIVIEGMGRAIHTNFLAKFSCDVIKAAVLKNRWLAQRLGGDMFSVIFKFEIT